jgi:hypothetical protein
VRERDLWPIFRLIRPPISKDRQVTLSQTQFLGRGSRQTPGIIRIHPAGRSAGWFIIRSITGLAKMQLDAHEEAGARFRRSVEINRNHPRTHFWLAAALARLGRLDEAGRTQHGARATDFHHHALPRQRRRAAILASERVAVGGIEARMSDPMAISRRLVAVFVADVWAIRLNLLRCMSPKMALFGSGPTDRRCPFTGQKRKSLLNNPRSVDDRCCRKKPCRKPVAGLFTCSWPGMTATGRAPPPNCDATYAVDAHTRPVGGPSRRSAIVFRFCTMAAR